MTNVDAFLVAATGLNTAMSFVAIRQRHLATYKIRRKLRKKRRKARQRKLGVAA
jgi:hypothetical protein